MASTPTVYVDTNVLIDFLLRREPHYRPAARIFDWAERGGGTARASAISFNNIFYISRKIVGTADARDLIVTLRRLVIAVPLDESTIDRALALPLTDFEDAIQQVSAADAGAAFIVTRDPRHFASSPVPAVSPEQALALLGLSKA